VISDLLDDPGCLPVEVFVDGSPSGTWFVADVRLDEEVV
jgi:hypothetical protein